MGNSFVTFIAPTVLVIAIVLLGGCPRNGPGIRGQHKDHQATLETELATPTPAMPARPSGTITAPPDFMSLMWVKG